MFEVKSQTISSLVRPTISILFTVLIWVGFFMGQVSGDILLGIYGTIIGFWFGERSALKTPNNQQEIKHGSANV